MTIVERAIERLRRAGDVPAGAMAAPAGPAVIGKPIDAEADPTGLHPSLPGRIVAVDREALRREGYLPEHGKDRLFADHYRQIKRPLIAGAFAQATPGKASQRLIMMASALPGDGKTFTSINLALSMARERDLSVVLVDADAPKPHVSRIFGVEKEPGLLDALADNSVDVESLVLPTDVKGLSILPAGRAQEGATELFASGHMAAVVGRLLQRSPRRVVLFDSPPLLVSTESRALATSVGQLVLVVRSGKTPRQAVLDAMSMVGEGPQVSLVLNQGRRASSSGYGDAYYYGQAYGTEQQG